jgi:hypothetical protein
LRTKSHGVCIHGRKKLGRFRGISAVFHPNIRFTMATELDSTLPFLDVPEEMKPESSLRHAVYR